ncbi:hypothetical protein HanXRQr2_Chr12g0538901 [Helianthus annuus]|uniref:Uncharacterized protein n=1 Tax=Helianthus annuus TaxID=4232 RepID=A0A9K3HG58_HELAN|nr:hypothetical protein HanXRQr2_Chr12g0538901 [Helianthus annuus]
MRLKEDPCNGPATPIIIKEAIVIDDGEDNDDSDWLELLNCLLRCLCTRRSVTRIRLLRS